MKKKKCIRFVTVSVHSGGGKENFAHRKRKNAYSSFVHATTGLSHKCSNFTEDREGDEGMKP